MTTSASENMSRTITVRAEPIELCQLLKFAGLADNGGAAKAIISEGQVLLNGVVETQKRKKVMGGDRVTLGEETIVVKVG
ncbi:MAG: RNA-binding S4 domain-containing protein [Rariglobus sp.]|nr:RNA-binding S4 domain-containing protein [Rariglobus sp.]